MKRKLKSTIAVLLVLALCISIAPFSILAAENPFYAPGTVVSDDEDSPPAGITGDSPPSGLVVEGDEEPFVPDAGASSENSGNSPTAAPLPTTAPESSGATPGPANTLPPDTFAVSDGEVVVAPAREQANVEGGTAAKVWPEQKGRAVGDRAQVRILYYCLSQDVGDTESIGYVTQMPAKAILYPSGEYVSAYCLAAHLPANDGVEYTWTDLTTNQQKVIGTIMALGFKYKGNTEWFGPSAENDQWAVTQFMIWASQNGYISKNKDDLITVDSVVDRDMAKIAAYAFSTDGMMAYYQDLKKRLEDFYKIPSFAAAKPEGVKTALLRWNGTNYTTKLVDKNQVLSKFNFAESLPGFEITQSGNELTVSRNSAVSNTVTSKRVDYLLPATDKAVIVWETNGGAGGTGEQPIATYDEGEGDPLNAYIAAATVGGTPGGDGTLIKTSEDGIVSGITFKITGSDGKSYTKTTNANGEISLKDLPVKEKIPLLDADGNPVIDPDTGEAVMQDGDVITYTATETTPIRYVEPASQTFTLDHGDVILEFDNVLKKWQVIVSKRDKETGGTAQGDASLGGAKYGIYKDGTLLDTYTTGLTGRFTSEWYPCGSGYTLKEISPSTGYLLEPGSVSVGMEPGATTVEFNTTTQTVTEQVIKGKVAIVKHTDQGDTGIETPEKGAEFQIYLASSGSFEKAVETERDTITCDADGYAKSKDLPYGTYTVHQTKGWEGKEMVADFQVSVHENGKTYAFILNNRIFESMIQIMKRDKESGRMIPASGIGFKVRNTDTGEYVVQKITYPTPMDISIYFTDVTGKLMMPEKLGYGNYELIEQNTAYGYILDSTPVPFKVDGTQKTITVEKENLPQKGIINIEKQGEMFASVKESKGVYTPIFQMQKLPGAVFEIRAAENITTPDGTLRVPRGEVVGTVTTDSFGAAASQELYLGKYTVKETKAPAGMVLSNVVHEVTLSYAGQTVELTSAFLEVTDARQRCSLDLEKRMEQDDHFELGMNKEYENVKFSLYAAKELTATDGKTIPVGGLLETTGINENGHGDFAADLPFGSYYVQETATDEHYVTSDTKYPIEFAYAGQEKAVGHLHTNNDARIENKLIRGQVNGKKVDEDGNNLAGALIGFFRPEEVKFTKDTAIFTVISGANGAFAFKNIPLGKWIVREIQAPEGFLLSDKSYAVEITAQGQEINITLDNIYIKGNVELTKVDSIFNGNKLTGAAFDVYRDVNGDKKHDEDDKKVGELQETKKGIYTMEGLRYGGYHIIETKAPADYEVDPTPLYFEIKEQGKKITLTFENEPQLGSLKIVKAADDGKIAGIKFTVAGQPYTGSYYSAEFETDEKGEIFVKDLRAGEYTVTEVKDASTVRYLVSGDRLVTVEYGKTTEAKVYNKLIRGDLSITKTDEDDPTIKLQGAAFEVYRDLDGDKKFNKEKDTLYGKLEDMKNGSYWLHGLPYGEYFLHETVAPTGFVPDEKYYYFEIRKDGQKLEFSNTDSGKTFVNRHITGELIILKKAQGTGAILKDVPFVIQNEAGETVADGKTNEKGIVRFENLRYGKYTYKEISAPNGYILDDKAHPFEITKDKQVIEVEVVNVPKPTPKPTCAPTATPKVYTPSPTGDSRMNPVGAFVLLGVGAIGFAALVLVRARKRKKNAPKK